MESSLRSDISRIYGRIGNDFMNQNETQWDKLLKIKTTGRDDSRSDQYRYPYEPTQYCVLERLANNGLITKKNVLLDYGTGKGRVCFYLSYQTRCRSIGVEYDERIFESAEANREHAVSGRKVSFELTSAEKYTVQDMGRLNNHLPDPVCDHWFKSFLYSRNRIVISFFQN